MIFTGRQSGFYRPRGAQCKGSRCKGVAQEVLCCTVHEGHPGAACPPVLPALWGKGGEGVQETPGYTLPQRTPPTVSLTAHAPDQGGRWHHQLLEGECGSGSPSWWSQ